MRMRERRVEKPRKPFYEMPRSTVAGIFIALFVLLLLVSATLLFLSFDQPVESTPDSPRKIWYTAGDGAIINGTFYPALSKNQPTVYLVHDIGSRRTVWNEYALELQKEDYNVLAIDLRGHGSSTLNIKSPETALRSRAATEPGLPDPATVLRPDNDVAGRVIRQNHDAPP